MDGIQNRIRTLQSDIEKLDQVDRIVLLDVGGHVILNLDSIDVQKVKIFLDNEYGKELVDFRHAQRMVAWTSQVMKEGIIQ